jgi:hypothetical protein
MLNKKNSISNYGSTISASLKTSKNPNNDLIKSSRIGAGDDDVLQSSYTNFKSIYAKIIVSSSRRKRQTTGLTCANLQAASPDSFTATDLSTISSSVFQSCLSTLGASTNSYSTDQLTALLSIGVNGASVFFKIHLTT